MPQYLNKSNKSTLSKVRVSEYPLPYDSETIVRIKSQPMGRMNRYSEAVQAGGQKLKTETYKLIADSVVDESGESVFDSSEVKELSESDTRFVTSLIKMITKHNGGSDQDVEEIAGNLEGIA